jgi:two-component system LytT family response regulator
VKILVVDDEPLARRGLRHELERIPGMTCVAECAGTTDAVAAIVERAPDVVLLDVQLGRATGFEVIEQVGVDAMPLVIFVTAYDRHALRAFEVNAVDYVLKPVDPERLREALARAAHLLSLEQGASLADRLERILAAGGAAGMAPAPAAPAADRLVVRDGPRLAFVDIAAVDWMEADGNYVRVHVGARAHSLRTTMARMEQRVGMAANGATPAFVRIRRSALVNVNAILTLEPYGKGMYVLRLRNGAKLISSRYHQAGLRRLLRADQPLG